MKNLYLLPLFLLLSFITNAQEICDNAIDDDGDGRIDLNDEECPCGISSGTDSIIPNPSFEDIVSCPSPSQNNISTILNWEESSPSPDHFHTCRTSGLFIQPAEGESYVGIAVGYYDEIKIDLSTGDTTITSISASESIGTCLNRPLRKGGQYDLQMSVAISTIVKLNEECSDNAGIRTCRRPILLEDSVILVIYGSPACPSFPLKDSICFAEQGFDVLDTIVYYPDSNWNELQFDFVPDENIESIIIGFSCFIPKGIIRYCFIDNLILNETDSINQLNLEGDWCSNDIILRSDTTFVSGTSYQWFRDGIAIIGAQDSFLAISENNYGSGNYTLQVNGGAFCYSTIVNEETCINEILGSDQLCVGEFSTYMVNDTMGGRWLLTDSSKAEIDSNGRLTALDSGSILVLYEFQSGASLDTLFKTVEIGTTIERSLNATTCAGNGVQFGGQEIFDAGIYIDTFLSQFGCDSIVTLELRVREPDINRDTLFACSDTIYNSIFIDSDTILSDTMTGVGCGTVNVIYFFIQQPIINADTSNLCAGDTVNFRGQFITNTSQIIDTFSAEDGCDSFRIYHFIFNSQDVTIDTIQFCSSIEFAGLLIESDTILMDTIGLSQCADIQTTVFQKIGDQSSQELELSLCEGDTLSIAGNIVTEAGQYLDTLISVAGCDSIVRYIVSVERVPEMVISETICEGDTLFFNNTMISDAGEYRFRLNSDVACDSIIVLNVDVLTGEFIEESVILCEGDSIEINGAWITESGIYRDTLGQGECSRITEYRVQVDSITPPFFSDTVIAVGSSFPIVVDLDPNHWSVEWMPEEVFSCSNCLSTMVSTSSPVRINAQFVNGSTCVYNRTFFLDLFRDSLPPIYIPNIINLNSLQDINRQWVVEAPTEYNFEAVYLFDRWGNKIREWRNQNDIVWDGTMKGQAFSTGVVVYQLRARHLSTGRIYSRYGTITVLRE